MGGKSQPDFGEVAAAEGDEMRQSVLDQLFANRPDQASPWGYTSWEQTPWTDPETGETHYKWTQTTGLTPELQELYNKQLAIQGGRTDLAGLLTGRLGSEYGQAMDWSGLNPWGESPQMQQTLGEGDVGNPYETRQRAEDAMYNQAMSRLAPQFESERQQMEIKLRNQGLSPGDAAYDAQMQGVQQRQTDATNQAVWSATDAGRAESGQMFNQLLGRNQNAFQQALAANNQNYNQMMQSANYQNQMRQAQMAEAMQQRGWSLNEINALLSGQQVGMPSFPGFMGAGQAGTPNYAAAAAQDASMANANNPWGQLLGAGVSLGSAALMGSDRRIKRNIKRIGTVKGHPWYSFEYIWGTPAEGVMADEVPEEYVVDIGGVKHVNYTELLGG